MQMIQYCLIHNLCDICKKSMVWISKVSWARAGGHQCATAENCTDARHLELSPQACLKHQLKLPGHLRKWHASYLCTSECPLSFSLDAVLPILCLPATLVRHWPPPNTAGHEICKTPLTNWPFHSFAQKLWLAKLHAIFPWGNESPAFDLPSPPHPTPPSPFTPFSHHDPIFKKYESCGWRGRGLLLCVRTGH